MGDSSKGWLRPSSPPSFFFLAERERERERGWDLVGGLEREAGIAKA